MMEAKAIRTDKAPLVGFSSGTAAPLSQAIVFNGLVFCSGQGPLDPDTHTVATDDFAAQTKLTLENMVRVVEAAGSSRDRILKCNCYLSDMENFPTFNAVYREFFEDSPQFPARTTVRADAPRAGVLVEIECVAALAEEPA